MKKYLKKLFLLMAVVMTAVVSLSFGTSAEVISENVISDTFYGTNITYTLDIESKVFTLSGSGDMINTPVTGDCFPGGKYNGCIEEVVIEEGVTIKRTAMYFFSKYPNLKKVTFPSNMTIIPYGMFSYCPGLINFCIPEHITSIDWEVFLGCVNLKSVTIPNSVISISKFAFDGCTALTDVYYLGTEEQWNKIEIGECNEELLNSNIHFNHKHTDLTSDGFCDDCTAEVGRGHKHTYTASVTKKPTCISNGTKALTCSCGDKYTEVIKATGRHTYKTTITKAMLKKNGKVVIKCTVCGNVSKTTTIYYPKTFKLSATSYIYNGEVKKPTVTVKDSKGNVLKKDIDYTVKYETGRKAPGTYNVKITFKGKYSGTKTLKFTIAPKATSKITAVQSTKAIKLTWSKVTGADGYRIYQYNTKTKKWDSIKTLKTTSFKVQNLKAGTAYKFQIKAYTKDDSTIWGKAATITVATKPDASKITKLTTAKAKATLTWSDVNGESGYEIYASTKKDGGFKKVASTKANVTKATVSKLTSGKTYYFKVRSYKSVNGVKVYSAWSGLKSVKIK